MMPHPFSSNVTVMAPMGSNLEGIELAGRTMEKMLHGDGQFPSLQDKLRVGLPGAPPTLSGLQEPDYPTVEGPCQSPNLRSTQRSSLHQRSSVHKVPLPEALVEQFGHVQCNCMIGIFPEIDRAWLTIDSDIYVWRFEDKSDLAFYDSLSDAILSVALVAPKPNIFKNHIKYLLCLTTATEVVLLGVTFSEESVATMGYSEMHLLPEPLYSLSTDSVHMLCVKGTSHGRVFLGGRDGCLYEFAYKADEGWFGKKAQKINHSTSSFSFLIPSFVNAALSEEDPIVQLEVDDSRNILYTRSEKGTIQVFDLGPNGCQTSRVTAVTQQAIAKEASKVALNIDASNFSPIIGIWHLSYSESTRLHLVAISGNGVRFYFSVTGPNLNERPTTLSLLHIRLPPGFAASSPPSGKPNKAHISYYRNGTTLLGCAQNDSLDQLWLLSGDSFPFQNILMEGQSLVPVDGRIWALEEVPYRGHLTKLHRDSFSSTEPPLVTIQHSQPARKFVLVSAQGTHIVSKLRPVDHLRQLLIDNDGPEGDVVKGFFAVHTDVQAACTCLILACSQSVQEAKVSEWATRALFLYGGEPRLIFPPTQQSRPPPQGLTSFSASFHPNIASTPAPNIHHTLPSFSPQRQMDTSHPLYGPAGVVTPGPQGLFGGPVVPELQHSVKHNALYLYLSRLIRPVWLRPVVLNSSQREAPFESSVTSDELGWIMAQLQDFRTFFERQAHLLVNPGPETYQLQSHQAPMQDAFFRERQSLLFLQHLLNQTIQVLGLWRIVCDHLCNSVVILLSQEEQNLIRGIFFRDLVLAVTGRELCGKIIQAVINLYLGDNARTDAISNRLRDACPTLYNNDDALATKAQEILISAKHQTNVREREKMINEAVLLCKEVAGKLCLEVLVSHLVGVHAYVAVVEICLAAASKRDPQCLALHHYRNMEPVDDHQGAQFFHLRTSCYKHVTHMLKTLMGSSGHLSHNSTVLPSKSGPPAPPDPNQLDPSEASQHANQVLESVLRSDDELFHVEVYHWLIREGHHEKLLKIRSPFIEDFLIRFSLQNMDSVLGFDLLWKYYEIIGNYRNAARFLVRLAEGQSVEMDLKKRLEYLSRAVVCVKSVETNSASAGDALGDIHSLEEKMEVARVQLKLLETISSLPQTQQTSNAIAELHSGLIEISRLYSDFAEPLNLWECQLAILHCAGHPDQMLAQTMWTNILEGEWNRTHDLPGEARIKTLADKVISLGKLYSSSMKYFPLDHIVKSLEIFSVQLNFDFEWVFKAILAVGTPLATVLEVYHKLNSINDPIWLTHDSPNHLLIVLTKLLGVFANNPNIVSSRERRHFLVRCQDIVTSCLGILYKKHDSQNLVHSFRAIQSKFERMESTPF